MLEIDGEFFKDPIELRRKEKLLALANVTIEYVKSKINILNDKNMNAVSKEFNLLQMEEVFKVQYNAIVTSPLFPNTFGTGGIVCGLPDNKIAVEPKGELVNAIKNNNGNIEIIIDKENGNERD